MAKFKLNRVITIKTFFDDVIEVEATCLEEAIKKAEEESVDNEKVWGSMYLDAISFDSDCIENVEFYTEN